MISIIVPVYNTEKYLDRCIGSLVEQNEQDIEILLIDDSSTDNSGKVIDEWALKDCRIRAFHKTVNLGVSDSRNMGLQLSRGEYIGFVDSDDWIDPDMYSEMLHYIKNTNADVAIGGYKRHLVDDVIDVELGIKTGKVLSIEETLSLCMPQRGEGRYNLFIWNKLFHRRCIYKGERIIEFDKKAFYSEDVLWLVRVLFNSNKVVCNNKCSYNYLSVRDGNTWSSISRFSSMELCENAIKTNVRIYDLIKERCNFLANNAYQRVLYYYKMAILTADHLNDEENMKRYSRGYVKKMICWWLKNRSFIGLKWAIKEMIEFYKIRTRFLIKRIR